MSFGTEIRVGLLRQGLTIEQLARKIGLSRNALSKKINGHSEFTANELFKITKALNMSLVELINKVEKAEQGK